MKSAKLLTLAVAWFSVPFLSAQSIPVSSIHFLSCPGASNTLLNGVSNNDIGVGTYIAEGDGQHGYMVHNGKCTTIDNPDGTTWLIAANSNGTLVGYYNNSGNFFAFSYSNGVFTNLGPPGGTQTFANGINDNGVITGSYLDPITGLNEGWVLENGTYETVLSPQNGASAFATDTNINGITTLWWINSVSGYVESSIYDGTTYRTANVPGATNSYIRAIDASGDTVYEWQDSAGNDHGAVQVDGRFRKFDIPGCNATVANGINDHHLIVGSCATTAGPRVGFYVKY